MSNLTTGLADVVLIVKDVKRAASFYRYALGLSAASEATAEWAWFWTGAPGQSPRLGLHKGNLPYEEYAPATGQEWGRAHLSLQLPAANVEEAIARARVQGTQVFGPREDSWSNATSYYFFDFDGNLIALSTPRQ